MEKKRKIAQYRERLDKTLVSPELTNQESLKTLVKNQLLNSSLDEIREFSENVVDKKTTEVFNFLDMLRSASVKDNEVLKTSEASHGQWKLKQDTEEVRIMYREGPQGTPFHSLLVEGYIDAPLDVCLCVSWESTLYRKWWPQYNFPPFKVITSDCLQKVRIGEQISLVRVKVTWPLSSREGVVHYFLFEYFQDGLMIVLINSINDLKSIDRNTHGFTNEGIPEAKDVIRIELVGGFALQKVTEERSFFRTIVNMDMKLNFVPPSLINFIARQLIGDGFKLYQKAVATVSSYEEYRKALEEPLYTRVREALYSTKESNEALKANELKINACIPPEEHVGEGMQDALNEMEQKVDDGEYSHNDVKVTDRNAGGEIEEEESEENTHLDEDDKRIDQSLTKEIPRNHDSESSQNDAQAADKNIVGEIEEEASEDSTQSDKDDGDMDQSISDEIVEKHPMHSKKAFSISLGVEQALVTLENAIYIVREHGFNGQSKSFCGLTDEKPMNAEMGAIKDSTSTNEKPTNAEMGAIKDSTSEEDIVPPDVDESKEESIEKNLQESRKSTGIQDFRHTGSNSYAREVNHNRIAPASPERYLSNPDEINQVALSFSQNGTMEVPIFNQIMHDSKQRNAEAYAIPENAINGGKKLSPQKKQRFCCFPLNTA